MLERVAHDLLGLLRIRGNNNGQIWNDARPGEVFNGVMGRTELAVSHTGGHATKLYVPFRVPKINLDLLHRAWPSGNKMRRET